MKEILKIKNEIFTTIITKPGHLNYYQDIHIQRDWVGMDSSLSSVLVGIFVINVTDPYERALALSKQINLKSFNVSLMIQSLF